MGGLIVTKMLCMILRQGKEIIVVCVRKSFADNDYRRRSSDFPFYKKKQTKKKQQLVNKAEFGI